MTTPNAPPPTATVASIFADFVALITRTRLDNAQAAVKHQRGKRAAKVARGGYKSRTEG